jgi:AraC family transcriptional regulator, arabinose operon regulatory protein
MTQSPQVSRINSAGITHCEQDWSWDTSRRPPVDHDIWTVLSGQGELCTTDRSWPLLPGDCFILRPGGVYVGSHDPNHPLLVVHIHFDPVGAPLEFHRRLTNIGFIREVLTRSVFGYREGRQEEAILWLDAALTEIQNQERHADRTGSDDGRGEKINTICHRIYEDPSAPYRVEKLAQAVGLSADHFTRLFRKLRGVTPREYILQARIESAQNLLLSSNHSIGRIAEILGYSDVYFFSRQFKEKVGVSPSAFRK